MTVFSATVNELAEVVVDLGGDADRVLSKRNQGPEAVITEHPPLLAQFPD